MRCNDFHFELPQELIAQNPLPVRSQSRLLSMEGVSGALDDGHMVRLPDKLLHGDLLVFNDTRVIPARLFGVKASGGQLEMLVERVLDDHRALVHIRASKSPKTGAMLRMAEAFDAEVAERRGELYEVLFHDPRSVLMLLEQYGHIPLPPYIARPDNDEDRRRSSSLSGRAM